MLFFHAARSESNFQMSEIKHAAEASTFHLETRVAKFFVKLFTVDTAIVLCRN